LQYQQLKAEGCRDMNAKDRSIRPIYEFGRMDKEVIHGIERGIAISKEA
jgi:hypothetical protein